MIKIGVVFVNPYNKYAKGHTWINKATCELGNFYMEEIIWYYPMKSRIKWTIDRLWKDWIRLWMK